MSMARPLLILPLLLALLVAAVGSLAWGGQHALATSKDLMSRADEVALFRRGVDPYRLPSMTYPPTALPVFAPLVAPLEGSRLRVFWLALNVVALAVLAVEVVRLWGEHWPGWLQLAVAMVIVASKPARGGIGLGQFHLIPTALMIVALHALRARRTVLAGILVAVALAKPTMVLPFLGFLAVRGYWRTLATALALQGAAFAGVVAWLRRGPVVLVREWLETARSQLAEGLIDVPSLVQRHWPAAPISASRLALVVLVLGLVATWIFRRRSELTLTSFCLFVAAIFTYHRPYDLVLLVPAFASMVDRAHEARGPATLARGLAAVVFALMLVAPSNPAVTGSADERLHEAAFVGLSYAFLALLLWDLARAGYKPGTSDGLGA
jgi:hypothetical protein